jgi:uncharacterized membrane protein
MIMNKRFKFFGSLGVGALLMYVLDPQVGRRRRAVVRDKLNRLAHNATDAVDVTARDLQNRVQGMTAKARSLMAQKEVSDDTLAQRIRSKLGGWVSHASSIEVNVQGGKVTLSGPILAREVDLLVSQISSMKHVSEVDNKLEVHENPDSVPGLQGQSAQRNGQVPDLLQVNWSPTSRFIAGTLGGSLALYGARKLSIFGTAVASLGAAILARALTNMEFKRLIGIGAGRRAIDFHKIINVAAPVENVFSFWSNYKNFPRFMTNVRDVQQIGNDRSHWVVAGPAGVPVEWTAVVTKYEPNRTIGWKTIPGSPVAHAGLVRFDSNPDGTTRIDLRLSYNPVAGMLGHLVASLFGADPKSEIDADLARMKTMIEDGVPPHDAAQKAPSDRMSS